MIYNDERSCIVVPMAKFSYFNFVLTKFYVSLGWTDAFMPKNTDVIILHAVSLLYDTTLYDIRKYRMCHF